MATQSQLDAALKAYQDAVNAVQTAESNRQRYRKLALDCQAARDEHWFGPSKNKACDINDLNSYYNQWEYWENEVSLRTSNKNAKKSSYDEIKEEWESQVESQIELQESDPETQQARIEKEKESDKNQRMIIISVVIILGLAITIVLWRKLG